MKLSQFRGLKDGNVQVWYQKDMRSLDYFDPQIDPKNLEATHVHLGNIQADDEEQAFEMMQGESYSPRGEAFEFIQSKGVKHTSMMVNDIVVIDGNIMLANPVGWSKL